MEGYQSKNRWIDLSSLPRKLFQNKTVIDWRNSVGYQVPFQFDKAHGLIKIIKCERQKNNLNIYITIDKYVPNPRKIRQYQLLECRIYRLVGNRIADYAPHLIKYLANPNDAYLYPYQSNNNILIQCPICRHQMLVSVSHLYYQGKQCTRCGDGLSYPNKLMFNILKSLKVDFINEVNKSDGYLWMKDYRYDFYINKNGKNILIEMDGGFHRTSEQQARDSIKTKLAQDNNFELIRIDCEYGHHDRFKFIKTNILNSRLNTMYPLNTINWDECNKLSLQTMISKVCFLWEEDNKSIRDIMILTKLSHTTVWRYLKEGRKIGLCPSYNIDEARKRRHYYTETNNNIKEVA